MSTIITAEHLTKSYRLGAIGRGSLQQDFASWWARTRGKPDPLARIGQERHGRRADGLFWALDDVSFEVREGEVLGVVGRNGAGKSTLLKILSQVTAPTSGQVTLEGRVASLLEVGTGFHPELTGRENVFLNGAILGMTKAEIREKFDEIVAFSECETFIDTPVKRYSSGMYVRLAFAIAAHLEPEILIVDEVLAVGDGQFQQKCLGKMEEVGKAGRTILFVSHQLASVQRLCTRAVLLEGGRLTKAGDVSGVIECYLNGSHGRTDRRRQITVEEGDARIMSWSLSGAVDGREHCCLSRDVATFDIVIESRCRLERAHVGFVIRTLLGDQLISAQSIDDFQKRFTVEAGTTHILATVRLPIKTGRYRLDVTLSDEQWGVWDHWLAEPLLTILPSGNSVLPPDRHGLINEPVSFEVR